MNKYVMIGAAILLTGLLAFLATNQLEKASAAAAARYTVQSLSGDHEAFYLLRGDAFEPLRIGKTLTVGDELLVIDPDSRLALVDGHARTYTVCSQNSPYHIKAMPVKSWFQTSGRLEKRAPEIEVVTAQTRSSTMAWPLKHAVRGQNQVLHGQAITLTWLPAKPPARFIIRASGEAGKVLLDQKNPRLKTWTIPGDFLPKGLYNLEFLDAQGHSFTLRLAVVSEMPKAMRSKAFSIAAPSVQKWLRCKKMAAIPDWRLFSSFICTDRQTRWMLDAPVNPEINQKGCL